jgi:hypothetical protein
MKNLLHFTIPVFILLLLQTGLVAQTPEENLQNAVETYNAMRVYIDGITLKTVNQSNLDDTKSRMDKSVALLDKVIREGNSDQIKTARYFRNNAKYQYSYVLGMKGANYQAFDVMKEIERDVTAFTAADFPFRYTFYGKNYVINWDNFASTQAEFLVGFAEVCYNLSKYEDAVRVNKKAIAHPNLTDWLRYVSINKMLDIYEKNNSLLASEEQTDYALKAMQEYDKLSSESKEVVKEYNYPTVARSADILVNNTKSNPSPQAVSRCAEAAPIVIKYDQDNPNALKMIELCYVNKYQSQIAWDRVAYDYANVLHTKSQLSDQKNLDHNVRIRKVALAALERLAADTGSSDCEALSKIAAMYKDWEESTKEKEYLKKGDKCLESRKKATDKAQKEARRSNRNFNFYVGADILPLCQTNPRRDYGAVVNFVFKETAIEFGYKIIRNNKENIFDLWINEVDDASQDNISRWDGFKAHFQPKFFTKDSDRGYVGFLLGYYQKDFDAMTVSVLNNDDGSYSLQEFDPSAKQYVGMFTMGNMVLGKGVGIEVTGGIGAIYNSFDSGNPLDHTQYTIDNILLENRKDNYWSPVMRLGITMGLNFGRGRS